MLGRRIIVFAAFVLLFPCVAPRAGGVFLVSRQGVEAYDQAKNGFFQIWYTTEMAGTVPESVALDGSDADAALLGNLKGAAPDLVFTVGSYATKKVREALPGVWIVYAMVYYPEAEGFQSDPKMVGVDSLGSARELARVLKTFKRDRSVAVLHSEAIAASIPKILEEISARGISAIAYSVRGLDDLQRVLGAIQTQPDAILILPDPVTANPDALRFILSKCLSWGVLPVTYSDALVGNGALCGTFYPPASVGNEAARVARALLTGEAPAQKTVVPKESSISCNNATARGLRLEIPPKLGPEILYE